jgi:ribosomal protein S18 acetylase RimI-like enzyme
MEVRSLGYRTDLMVRRLAGSSVVDLGDDIVVRTPDNPGFFWGNFLLLPEPPGAAGGLEAVARFERQFPDAGHVALGVDGVRFADSLDLPTSIPMEIDQGVVLVADHAPDRGPVEGDPQVRTLGSALDWRQVLSFRLEISAAEGPMPPGHTDFLARSTEESRLMVDRGHAEYVGAFEDGRLCSMVGVVSDGGGEARYQNVATLPTHRRRGYASLLVGRAGASGLSRWGASRLVIVAEKDSPASRLYPSLGFVPVEAQMGLLAVRVPLPGP